MNQIDLLLIRAAITLMLQKDPYIELALKNRLIDINKALIIRHHILPSEKSDIQNALSYSIIHSDEYQTEFQRIYSQFDKEIKNAVL